MVYRICQRKWKNHHIRDRDKVHLRSAIPFKGGRTIQQALNEIIDELNLKL
jgi:hypothetical protein